MNKFNVGEEAVVGNYLCQITKISKFGDTPHYGFLASGKSGYQAGTRFYLSGWMPCDMFDQIAKR